MAVLRLHRPTLMNIAEDMHGQLDRRNCVVPGPHIPPEICTLIGYLRLVVGLGPGRIEPRHPAGGSLERLPPVCFGVAL